MSACGAPHDPNDKYHDNLNAGYNQGVLYNSRWGYAGMKACLLLQPGGKGFPVDHLGMNCREASCLWQTRQTQWPA